MNATSASSPKDDHDIEMGSPVSNSVPQPQKKFSWGRTNATSASSPKDDHDIEMGSPVSIPVPQPPKKSCWSRSFTDYSQYAATIAAGGSACGIAYTAYKVDYISSGLFSLSCILNLLLIARTHCLGRLKSLGKQNQILAQNIADATKENLNLQQNNQKIQQEKDDFIQENEKIKTELEKDTLEVEELNKALKDARNKLDELGPLYTKFKELETQLGKQNDLLNSNEKNVAHTTSEMEREDNEADKFNRTQQDDGIQLDKENKDFSSRLQEFHQLVAKTQEEIEEFKQNYAKINTELARLKKTEKLMKDLNEKFKNFIAYIEKLSRQYPQLKPLIDALN